MCGVEVCAMWMMMWWSRTPKGDLMEDGSTVALFAPMYGMAGLNVGTAGERLAYAVVIAALLSACMMTMTRACVAACEDSDSAQGLASLVVVFFVLYAGFLKNGDDLQPYVVWIYWANPMSYALKAALMNEFVGAVLDCADDGSSSAQSDTAPTNHVT